MRRWLVWGSKHRQHSVTTMSNLMKDGLQGIGETLRIQNSGIKQTILIIVVVGLLWKFIRALFLSPLRHIPGPLIARLTPLRAISRRLPKRVAKAGLEDFYQFGDIYISKPDTVTICHPKDVQQVLGAKDSWKIDMYKDLADPVMSNLVTFSDPQLASRRRRQITPFLNGPGYLAKMEAVILEHGIQALKQKWDKQLELAKGNPIEINYRNDTQLATFRIMSALAFGRVHSNPTDGAKIVDWISATAVFIGVSMNFKWMLNFPFSLLLRKWLSKYREFVNYGEQSVSQRKEALSNNPDVKYADMLQAFIDAEDPDSKVKMSAVEVQAESVGMQLAGSETTSASLTWALHLLTLYPDALKRATEEVRSCFRLEHTVTYKDSRDHLPFLESFVYEVFRYAPITSGFMPRRSTKDLELQGHFIPSGTVVAFNLLALNNRPDIWDQPEKFIPDRFIGNEEAKRNIFAFSYGPRSCVGRNLAWIEIMTILANLLKDYDISLPEDAVFGPANLDERGIPKMMPSECHIVFAPVDSERDCRLRIRKRVV
ncbi:cytochrome P450 [Poronia punctata]|nr:cytochrome P450 [Poronia punctata]